MPKTPIHVYTRLNKLQFVNRAVLIDLLIFFISFIKKNTILFAVCQRFHIFAAVITKQSHENIRSKYILVVALRTTQKVVRNEDSYVYINTT